MHALHRVRRFTIVAPFTLSIEFDDDTRQKICFEGVLHGRLFGALRDPNIFKGVRLDEESGTLVWPNGADFDPATLHDWPLHGPLLEAQARNWVNAEVKASNA